MGKESVSEVEERLQGIRYHPDHIAEAMNLINVKTFSGDLPKEEFLSLVYENDEA